jgi:integrase
VPAKATCLTKTTFEPDYTLNTADLNPSAATSSNQSVIFNIYFLDNEFDDVSLTPPGVRDLAAEATERLQPAKSKERYEKTYHDFIDWCKGKNIAEGPYTENMFLAYMGELSKKYASTTLWTIFSMLKKMLLIKNSQDINSMKKVVAFLKRQSSDHTTKKASIFSRELIQKFMAEARDEDFLHIKVAILLGLYGACRKSELLALTIEDITKSGDYLMVNINDSKTGPRSFALAPSNDPSMNILRYYQLYIEKRPTNSPSKLFINYKNGKCTRQPIGKNTLAKYPFLVAQFLALPNPSEYTSHALRRSAATWMSDSGIDLINLKRFGGWKSDTAAQGYIAQSEGNKKKLANLLNCGDAADDSSPTSKQHSVTFDTNVPNITLTNVSNCSVNITFNK